MWVEGGRNRSPFLSNTLSGSGCSTCDPKSESNMSWTPPQYLLLPSCWGHRGPGLAHVSPVSVATGKTDPCAFSPTLPLSSASASQLSRGGGLGAFQGHTPPWHTFCYASSASKLIMTSCQHILALRPTICQELCAAGFNQIYPEITLLVPKSVSLCETFPP